MVINISSFLINDDAWYDEDCKKAKLTRHLFGQDWLSYMVDGGEYRFTTPGWPVLAIYKRKGNYIYCKYLDSGKIISIEKVHINKLKW